MVAKIHCLGVGKHYRGAVCGEHLGDFGLAVSRNEFLALDSSVRCGRCAFSSWVRPLVRYSRKESRYQVGAR